MKPALRQITPTPECSFTVRMDVGENMVNNWHYHPEIELLYMVKSAGTWMIGDHIGHFQSGDVILIGSHLPHCFRHEQDFISETVNPGATICVKFVREALGSSFFSLPETRAINELLNNACYGLQLTGATRKKAGQLIAKMPDASPAQKLIGLLSVLDYIEENKGYIPLSSSAFLQLADSANHDRLKLVFEYTFIHYNEPITLDKAASLLNMTPHSFCRYFKMKTGKTYIRFLMEVRIGHACRLLAERDLNVTEICYTCGYNNISHFNHQFKKITNKKPLEYRRDHFRFRV